MSQDFLKFMVHEFLLENNILWIRKINVFSTVCFFPAFYQKNIETEKHNSLNFWKSWSLNFFKNHGPWIFWKSMSMKFLKFMVHDFLKINVPRCFEIHGPWFFEIQCPKDFCDFGLLSRLAQAEGLIDYYMIFHYQKVSLLNYYSDPRVRGQY